MECGGAISKNDRTFAKSFPALHSCRFVLQRKCKHEKCNVILVTIIFYAEYVSFDNREAELQASPIFRVTRKIANLAVINRNYTDSFI